MSIKKPLRGVHVKEFNNTIRATCPICSGYDLVFDYYDNSITCLACGKGWVQKRDYI